MIRVMVVDDEVPVRSGLDLVASAASDIDVVATTAAAEALDTVRREAPDVVLLDVRMPDVDGLTVLRQLRALPEPPVVVAMPTACDADACMLSALRAGAAGFLLKDPEPDQLAQLERTLVTGGVVMSPKASRAVRHSRPGTVTVDAEDAARAGRLTGHEREVPVLVAEGLSDAGTGALVPLGRETVEGHAGAILGKPRGAGRVQAELLARRAGLLDGGLRPARAGR